MAAPSPTVAILADSAQPRSIKELAERSGGTYGSVHKAVHALEGQGLLEIVPHGRQRLVQAASSNLPGMVTEAMKRSAKHLEDVLWGDHAQLLWVLHRTSDAALTAEVLGRSTSGVYQAIRRWRSGLLVKEVRGYRIHRHHQALIELLAEMDRLRAESHLEAMAPGARLLWHLGPELLVSQPLTTEAVEGVDPKLANTPPLLPGFEPGGLDAFAAYGIPIQTRSRTLFHSRRDTTAADAIMQALVAARYKTPFAWSPESPIVVGPEFSYACLLYEKETPKDIWKKSDLYFDDEHPARDVAEYVTEKSDGWAGFPNWSDHERLRQMYGVGA